MTKIDTELQTVLDGGIHSLCGLFVEATNSSNVGFVFGAINEIVLSFFERSDAIAIQLKRIGDLIEKTRNICRINDYAHHFAVDDIEERSHFGD